MKLSINEMQVKGMPQGEAYKTGDWFTPLCSDTIVEDGAGAEFGLAEHEYANRAMFLIQAPLGRTYTFFEVCRLLGVNPSLKLSSFDRWGGSAPTEFWDGGLGYGLWDKLDSLQRFSMYNTNGKSNEKCKAERGCYPSEYLKSLADVHAGSVVLPLDFIRAMTDLALVHADILGIKLHPETVKAAQTYPEQYLLKVAEQCGDTSVLAVRHAAYLGGGDLGATWGTYFDDADYGGRFVDAQRIARTLLYASSEFFKSLYLVNLYFVNGRQAIVGLGFQDTNPMFILGKFTPSGKFVTSAVRVGRYFSTYADVLDVRDEIEDLKPLNCELKTYLCKTEREWHDGYNGGVSSCMAGFSFRNSPVRIYATTSHGLPDNNLRLLIQYTGELWGDDFKVQARAIVNIEKMQYVRAYGRNADGIMRALGYEEDKDCLDGCILAKIRNDGEYWLMVYSDGNHDRVDDQGDYWVLTYSGGDAGADTACGYLEYYDSDRERALCDNCDEYEDEDEVIEVETEDGTMQWCEDCRCSHATYTRGRGWVSDELLEREAAEEAAADAEYEEDEDEDEEAA